MNGELNKAAWMGAAKANAEKIGQLKGQLKRAESGSFQSSAAVEVGGFCISPRKGTLRN